ncbi:MAG: TOBE domain-containing protein, partial [Pseudoruegeria sp.]
QRVAMGRAIVRNPQVFLFDEPLSNLDAKLRVQIRLEIRKLQQRLGVTSIYVTHDQVEAMTLGDRLMVLNGGYVEQFGTPIELYNNPATVFVGGFIGSPAMNFIPASADGTAVTLENGVSINGEGGVNGPVTLGVRPEHLIVDENGPIRITVSLFEHLGANTLMHGTLENTDVELTVSIPGHVDAETGTALGFSASPDVLHIFDRDTGKRALP